MHLNQAMTDVCKVLEGPLFASALTLNRSFVDDHLQITAHQHPDAKFMDEV